jgi:hypothetical protein
VKARVIVAACACAVMAALAPPAHAAIAFRDKAAANTGANPVSTLTLAAPAALQVGDLMLATIGIRQTGNSISPPAGGGWTQVPNLNDADATSPTAIRQVTFYKVAAAGDLGASYGFSLGGTIARGAGGIAAYSGVDTSTPIDAEATGNSNGTAGTTATGPAVTTTNLRSAVIVADAWAGGVAVTPDATTTDRFSAASTSATASSNATIELADLVKATPGSTGTFSIGSSVSNKWVAQTIALNEMPSLTASFPSDYAWPALVPGTTVTSAEQTVNVTSNRAWGLQLTSDRSDGRSRQWNGSSYGALALANPMQWRTSSIGGVAQGTSFADLSGTASTAVTGHSAAAGAVAVGLTLRQQVSYADEAALPAGNTYRQNVSYTAQQGF